MASHLEKDIPMTVDEAKQVIRNYYNTVIMDLSVYEETKKIAADNGCLMKIEYFLKWANDNNETGQK